MVDSEGFLCFPDNYQLGLRPATFHWAYRACLGGENDHTRHVDSSVSLGTPRAAGRRNRSLVRVRATELLVHLFDLDQPI
jgi:hypothetical protein